MEQGAYKPGCGTGVLQAWGMLLWMSQAHTVLLTCKSEIHTVEFTPHTPGPEPDRQELDPYNPNQQKVGHA